MRRSIYIFTSLLLIINLSCNPAPGYKLDFAPPPNTSWPEDIYPSQIEENHAEAITKEYGGTEIHYGTDKSIYIARFSNQDEAITFFKQNILPEFKVLESTINGNINGQFYAEAHGNNNYFFGWINQRYVFVLKAKSLVAFNILVNNFKYISINKN